MQTIHRTRPLTRGVQKEDRSFPHFFRKPGAGRLAWDDVKLATTRTPAELHEALEAWRGRLADIYRGMAIIPPDQRRVYARTVAEDLYGLRLSEQPDGPPPGLTYSVSEDLTISASKALAMMAELDDRKAGQAYELAQGLIGWALLFSGDVPAPAAS